MTADADGAVRASDVYRAIVRNHAKLAYNAVDAWLNGRGPMPQPVAAVGGMEAQLRLQDRVAQALGRLRHEHGALDFETIEVQPLFDGEMLSELRPETRYDDVARALGGGGETVTRPEEVGPALDRAFAAGIPYLVNVQTDPTVAYPRTTTGV